MVVLHGNVGRKNDLKRVGQNNLAILEFSVATAESYKGERKTTWHNCKAFGARAETMDKYFAKGSEILLWGRIEVEKWEKDGQKRSRVSVTVLSFDFCGRKGDNPQQSSEPRSSAPPASQADAMADTGDDEGPGDDGAPNVASDDDLPF